MQMTPRYCCFASAIMCTSNRQEAGESEFYPCAPNRGNRFDCSHPADSTLTTDMTRNSNRAREWGERFPQVFLKSRRARMYYEPSKYKRQNLVLREYPRLVKHRRNLVDPAGVCATGHRRRGLFRCERCRPRCTTTHRRQHFLLRIAPLFADERAS